MCSGQPTIGQPMPPRPTFNPGLPPTQAPFGSSPVISPGGTPTSGGGSWGSKYDGMTPSTASTGSGAPIIPPAPATTALLIGESLINKVGVDKLKHPLIDDASGRVSL